MKQLKFRRAFTLLELVFVMIILGIVSSIGAELIGKVYGSYIIQRAMHIASTKSDIATKQIASRLTYRLNHTVIGKKLNGTYVTIENVTPGDDYRILEWIGYDNDSFSAAQVPGWSGFCDVNASTRTQYETPGSDLNLTSTIISNLGGSVNSVAILFNSRFYNEYTPVLLYHPDTMGFDGTPPTTISPATGFTGDTTINVSDDNTKTIYDQYKLTWSAYAIVPVIHIDDPDTDVDESKLFDLILYYDYQPWLGETYADGKSSTLMTNVTVFKFKGLGNTLRFKVCVQEKISNSETVNSCKEKAVIR